MDVREVKTRVSVQFQYRGPNDVKPCDWTQEERLQFEVPAGTPVGSIPVPAVGDTVSLTLTEPGKQLPYRVLSRHYRYVETSFGLLMDVDFVVTDSAPLEVPAATTEIRPATERRPVWGLAASVLILSGVSAAALLGLSGEHRHAAVLAASNQSLSSSVQDLQNQVRSMSDEIQNLSIQAAAYHPGAQSASNPPRSSVRVPRRPSKRSSTARLRKPVLSESGGRTLQRFQLAKSNRYNRVGPVSISVRQVSPKQGSCDLIVKASDGRVERRHISLHAPVMLTLPGRSRPLELVVDQIGSSTVKGHISEPKANLAQLATF